MKNYFVLLVFFTFVVSGCDTNDTNLTQKSSNAMLKNIIISNGTLTPSFNPNVYNYNLYFSFLSNINTVTITGEKEDEKASVSEAITLNNIEPGTIENVVITVTAENGIRNNYSIRIERGLGNEASFTYNLSLITEKIEIQNNNLHDPIFIWASTNDIVSSSLGTVSDAKKIVLPGNRVEIDAAIGRGTYRPYIIYTLPNGKTYRYKPSDVGNAFEINHETLILDFGDLFEGDIPEFREVFAINTSESSEARYGNTSSFIWTDRINGLYKILPNIHNVSVNGYVGNIEGKLSNGDRVWLPGINFFITDKNNYWDIMWE